MLWFFLNTLIDNLKIWFGTVQQSRPMFRRKFDKMGHTVITGGWKSAEYKDYKDVSNSVAKGNVHLIIGDSHNA